MDVALQPLSYQSLSEPSNLQLRNIFPSRVSRFRVLAVTTVRKCCIKNNTRPQKSQKSCVMSETKRRCKVRIFLVAKCGRIGRGSENTLHAQVLNPVPSHFLVADYASFLLRVGDAATGYLHAVSGRSISA